MVSVDTSPLGKLTEYVSNYSPNLLFPIARQVSRQALSLGSVLPFCGVDVWTAYEISWLDDCGKPQVAIAEFSIPCDSEFIVESKSFKLYLNSFNQSRFSSLLQVADTLIKDLSLVVGVTVSVNLCRLPDFRRTIDSPQGTLIDDLVVSIEHYHPEPGLLTVGEEIVEEILYSDLLKTNCPVTGQPDWASVQIAYRGSKIDRENLLRYIVSFREHQDFHEHCVERMFVDILTRCQPEKLSVYARYTRRGGLDINPFRTTDAAEIPPSLRLVRQ